MLFGRTPYEAVQNRRSALQRAVSCVSPSVVVVRGSGYHTGSEHALFVGNVEPAKLSRSDITLSVKLLVHVRSHAGYEGRWAATVVAYSYALRGSEGAEIIVYHYHPDSRSPIKFPHLHLGAGARPSREELQGAHLPTGHVELEDVLSMAIREFGVRPRRGDWAEILDTR